MILLDMAIIILLCVSTAYCWKLNKKLINIQHNNDDFSFLTENFTSSLKQADVTLSNLKALSGDTTAKLQDKIEKANFVINDLSFLSDKASLLADKLEKSLNDHKHGKKDDSPKEEVPINSKKQDVLKDFTNKNAIESLLKRMSNNKDSEQDNEGEKIINKSNQYYSSLKKI